MDSSLPDKPAGGPPTIQIGRQGDKVVLAVGGKPQAYFRPDEAIVLAAHLVKNALQLAAGIKLVEQAMDETYVEKPPIVVLGSKPDAPPTLSNS